jgi:hypothetical protein
VEDLAPVTLMVAWRAESRSAALAAFVRTAKQVADDTVDGTWPSPVTTPA